LVVLLLLLLLLPLLLPLLPKSFLETRHKSSKEGTS